MNIFRNSTVQLKGYNQKRLSRICFLLYSAQSSISFCLPQANCKNVTRLQLSTFSTKQVETAWRHFSVDNKLLDKYLSHKSRRRTSETLNLKSESFHWRAFIRQHVLVSFIIFSFICNYITSFSQFRFAGGHRIFSSGHPGYWCHFKCSCKENQQKPGYQGENLTIYTLKSVCMFFSLFTIHFLWYWKGEFV